MTHHLTTDGYALTKAKLDGLQARMSAILARTDHASPHRAEVVRSYEDMMRQYIKEMRLYEAAHPEEFQSVDDTGAIAGNG